MNLKIVWEKKIVLLILAFLISFSFALDVKIIDNNTIEITTTGMGAIIHNDLKTARDSAIKDAQRQAVEQGVGVAILGETYVKNAIPISSKILTSTQGIVKNFEVIKESHDKNFYYVTIKAVVLKAIVKKTISDILKSIGEPVVLLLFPNDKYDYASFYLENNLINLGLKIVSQDFSKDILSNEVYAEKIKSVDKDTLKKLAMLSLANYIIVGNVRYSEKYVDSYGMWSVRTLMRTEVIRADNGQIIDAPIIDEVNVGATKSSAVSKTMKNDIPNFSEKIAKDIIKNFGGLVNQQFTLIFFIKYSSQIFKIEDYLNDKGFENVKMIKRDEKKVRFNVITNRTIREIIELIEGSSLSYYADNWGKDWISFKLK